MVRTEKKKSRTQTNEKKSHWIDSFPLSWLSAMIAMFPHKNWSTFNSWCEIRKSNSAYVYVKYKKKDGSSNFPLWTWKKEDANEKKLSDKQWKNLNDLSYAIAATFQTVEIRKKKNELYFCEEEEKKRNWL